MIKSTVVNFNYYSDLGNIAKYVFPNAVLTQKVYTWIFYIQNLDLLAVHNRLLDN